MENYAGGARSTMESYFSFKKICLILISLYLSESHANPVHYEEFLISKISHPEIQKIIPIPKHRFTESRELIVWIEVKKPPGSDSYEYDDECNEKNDCLLCNIEKETQEVGFIKFFAFHPNLLNEQQKFEVDTTINSTEQILCLNNLKPDDYKAITFNATIDVESHKCREIKITLEIGRPGCRNKDDNKINEDANSNEADDNDNDDDANDEDDNTNRNEASNNDKYVNANDHNDDDNGNANGHDHVYPAVTLLSVFCVVLLIVVFILAIVIINKNRKITKLSPRSEESDNVESVEKISLVTLKSNPRGKKTKHE